MSQSIGVAHDRSVTLALVTLYSPDRDGNWLGHHKQAALLDAMLLRGASRDELEHVRPSFEDHIHHLKVEHGIAVAVDDAGVWSFDRQALLAALSG
jgi:hypothetical protein